MLELACVGGGAHRYIPTGNAFQEWSSDGTADLQPPDNAPFHIEMKCVMCGAIKWVNQGNA
jgi:hypothetical protein